ncbi:procalin-like isoform X2 [Rhodnius prolixus]
MIIAVTFVGILTVLRVQGTAPKGCQEVTEKTGLVKDKFFTGLWYVTHSRKGFIASVCDQYKMTSKSDGTIDIDFGYQNKGSTYKIKCQRKKDSASQPFPYDCQSEKTFKALIKVVDTDYSNYAVIYKCSNLQPTPIDDVLIFNRHNEKADIPEAAKPAISALGTNTNILTARKSTDCTITTK